MSATSEGENYAQKVDIFALGIVFLELLYSFSNDQEKEDIVNKWRGLQFAAKSVDVLPMEVS